MTPHRKPPFWLSLPCLAIIGCAALHAAEIPPPIVVGFERFAHRKDLSSQLGPLLISELSCVACHEDEREDFVPKRGPDLSGAGIRLQPDWISNYLDNPSRGKPGGTMPHVLGSVKGPEREQVLKSLVAYLRTQNRPFQQPRAGGANPLLHEFWRRGNVSRGEDLYHTIGCVACHSFDENREGGNTPASNIDRLIETMEPEELDEMGLSGQARPTPSVPLPVLSQKYSLQSLTMMLLDPAQARPSARMPNLRLSPDEAADIAAYLLKEKAVERLAPVAGEAKLIEQGRESFQQFRCANCHTTQDEFAEVRATPLAMLDLASKDACLADSGRQVRYGLTPKQQTVVRSCLDDSDQKVNASESVRLQFLKYNCYGCHDRESIGGVGRDRRRFFETSSQVDLGDEGRLPPSLTGVGGKLNAKSLKAVFDAKSNQRRDYMTIRMPSYHQDRVRALTDRLARADDASNQTANQVFGSKKELAKIGRELVGTGCAGCHPFRGEALPGVIGIELDGATERLRPTWFQSFLTNPVDLKARTRMPTFFPDGKSNRPDLLGGDVNQQIAAIWHYLDNLDREPLPEKIAELRSQNYELIPKERPIVIRTFMRDVGTHAIAVGFPQQIHYAFDAESCRLALVWRGRFLDAKGTWFERFTPPADPLADSVLTFTVGGPMVYTRSSDSTIAAVEHQFKGYRLDHRGIPSMLYRVKGYEVSETITPIRNGIRRQIRVVSSPRESEGQLHWRLLEGKHLKQVDASTYQRGTWTVRLVGENSNLSTIQVLDSGETWLVPLSAVPGTTLKAEFSWKE